MAYTINLTNGTTLTTIADGTVNDTSSSLTLIGKNYAGYGTFLNDNLVHLLENFSDDTQPAVPLTGQLWWDTAGNLKVYTGSAFKTLGSTTSSGTAPSGAVTGNAWWDTINQQLNIYNGTGWTLVGPAFTSNTGTSGTIVGTILDNTSPTPQSHVAVNVYVSNTLVAIVSKDATYTPATAITGFSTIKPGFNLISTSGISGVAYWGTASDASGLGNVAAANYARTDIAETFDNTLTINNNGGLKVGTSNNFKAFVNGTRVELTNDVNNADTAIRSNIGGTVANVIAVTGSSGAITISNALSVSGATTSSGYLTASQGEDATSNVTGAVRVTGGIGLTGAIFATGNVTASSLNISRVVASGNISAANLSVSGISSLNSLTTSGNITAAALTVSGTSTFGGTAGVQSIVPTTANTYTLGSSASWFSTVYATAIQSYYADFAERFAADAAYEPGTVVEIGGEKEVTLATDELSDSVFGVISTNPAHLLNSGAGTNETHPPIAVNGRVPVKVIGKVKKGDRLVSAGRGYARAGTREEITQFNVIGRALESKLDSGKGIINAIVKLNS
jgi:hypothetical protein